MKRSFFPLLLSLSLSISASLAQNDPKCGTAGALQSMKIVGGVEATPFEFPWMAYLSDAYGACSGAIIHRQFILTAGHCADLKRSSAIVAVHNVSNRQEPGQLTVPIERIIRHPQYREVHGISIYDVALAKLIRPLNISTHPHLGTICLPPQAAGDDSDNSTWNAYKGQMTTAAGWGVTNPDVPYSVSPVLRKVALPVAPMDWCVGEAYHLATKFNLTRKEMETMICAYEVGKDTCQGDSGAPLMLKNSTDGGDGGRWTAVGVTSWGAGCAQKNRPGMYAHTALFTDWIWETVKKESE